MCVQENLCSWVGVIEMQKLFVEMLVEEEKGKGSFYV